MLWIVCNACVFIEEGRSGLLKGDAMFSDVLAVFDLVPNEVYIIHILNVYTDCYPVNSR